MDGFPYGVQKSGSGRRLNGCELFSILKGNKSCRTKKFLISNRLNFGETKLSSFPISLNIIRESVKII